MRAPVVRADGSGAVTSADPERLEAYAEETEMAVAATRAAVDDYRAALRQFAAAVPNDLGGPRLPDRAPAIDATLDELEQLAADARELAERFRDVDETGLVGGILAGLDSFLVSPVERSLWALKRNFIVVRDMADGREIPAYRSHVQFTSRFVPSGQAGYGFLNRIGRARTIHGVRRVAGPVGTAVEGVSGGLNEWNEEAGNIGLSTEDRVGRTLAAGGASIAGSSGGAWVGAKAGGLGGAAIGGVIGGPPGAAVGGAIGAVGGAVAGSAAGQ